LRNRADVAFKAGDKSLGRSYRDASKAIESVIERHLERGGNAELLADFRQARQHIATTYSVEEALQARITGEVNAHNLAAQLRKGKPLTGDLRTIADFATSFPKVSVLFSGKPQLFSPLDFGLGAASLAASGIAAQLGAGSVAALGLAPAALIPLAATLVRPGLRKGALSEVGRRSGFPKDRIRPSGGAVLGGALSGVAGGGGGF